jgi:hypothetical protein
MGTIFLALVVAWGAPSAAQQQPASISGVVTAALNGAPIAGAIVKLVDEPPATAPAGHQVKSTTTAADGSFRFNDVEPHVYWVVANLQGYLPAEYGQRSATATGASFDVAAGRRVNVRLAMWATSGISGRIVDGDGEPMGRLQVLALRMVYRDGKPGLTIAQTVMTNDRGEYRMFWLTPGSYRVAARQWDQESSAPAVNIGPPRRFATNEQGTSPVVARRALANGSTVEETHVPIYAPSTPDVQLATPITLGPGDSATAVDIQMAGDRVPARHVRGIYVRTEDNGRPALLMMVPRTQTPFAIVSPGVTRTDGSFDIAGVAPGSYLLYAQDASAMQPIDVGDADVDNVTLIQQPGISLKGRIIIDRGTSTEARANPQDFQIQMTREPYLVGAPDGGARFNPAPADDGAINLTAVAPGDYRLAARPFGMGPDGETLTGRQTPGPLRNAYMKSVRLGDADVLANGLHLPGPTSQQLEIVIGLNGAEVDGIASDGREPAANVVIVAVPDGGNRGRLDLYKRASTDARGHFAMAGLAPGDYTFYAWDDVERGAWESPEFMRAFEGRGRFVRLREGKNDPLELSVVAGR